MKNAKALENRPARRALFTAWATALALAVMLSPLSTHAHPVPPPVPAGIQVPAGHRAFLEGHAVGTQNYICLPSGATFGWILFGPQATLFDRADNQAMTHFLSANPDEGGTLRATWQHSRDTSAVWAMMTGTSSDPNFVEPGAIPWFRLQVVGAEDGPNRGDRLSGATYIQRLNTSGGLAPSTGCTLSTDVGKRAFVPYTADYLFYRAQGR
jgi:hypothetical protein